MSDRIYSTILRKDSKEFGYYADELCAAKSDYSFFQMIAQYIAPFFRQSSSLQFLYFKYIEDKDKYLKERNESESKASHEIECAFLSLNNDLRELLQHPEVQKHLNAIEQVLREKNRYGIPSYLNEAYDRIISLLVLLDNMNQRDIVKKYAKIGVRHVMKCNPKTKVLESIQESYIEQYTFASSILRLKELDGLWNYQNVNDFWIAWEYFFLIEWCWKAPFSFFENKAEKYDDLQSRNESVHLLFLHDCWIHVNEIKQRSNTSRTPSLINKDVYLKFLKLILNELIFEQGSCAKLSETASENIDDEVIVPYLLKIRFDDINNVLLLDVKWSEVGSFHVYIVHTFQSGSGPYNFAKAYNEAKIGDEINVGEVSKVSGASVAKYRAVLKMDNILWDLFFTEKEFNKTNVVIVKTKEVYCKDLSIVDRKLLKEYIKPLTPFPMQNII
jgi:hypothetical protein